MSKKDNNCENCILEQKNKYFATENERIYNWVNVLLMTILIVFFKF